MKFLLKLVLFIVLAPFVLLLVFVGVIAAVVGVPMLWEEAVKRFTAPPKGSGGEGQQA